jgi:hypothetical protein
MEITLDEGAERILAELRERRRDPMARCPVPGT